MVGKVPCVAAGTCRFFFRQFHSIKTLVYIVINDCLVLGGKLRTKLETLFKLLQPLLSLDAVVRQLRVIVSPQKTNLIPFILQLSCSLYRISSALSSSRLFEVPSLLNPCDSNAQSHHGLARGQIAPLLNSSFSFYEFELKLSRIVEHEIF